MTDRDIIRRSLWLCQQIPMLHEMSFQLGYTATIAEPESAAVNLSYAQMIIETADALAEVIRRRNGMPFGKRRHAKRQGNISDPTWSTK